MLQKSWNAVTLICGNHKGDQSHPMKLQQGPHSLFFSCPEYKSIYGDDHEGRSCNNRLTLVDYENFWIISQNVPMQVMVCRKLI